MPRVGSANNDGGGGSAWFHTPQPSSGVLIGTVVNLPRRRAVHARLFFLEVREAGEGDPDHGEKDDVRRREHATSSTTSNNTKMDARMIHQILCKHGKGGVYHNASELEALRRDIRQGDTVRIIYDITKHDSIVTKHGRPVPLRHAIQVTITSLCVHSNTGSAYRVANPNDQDTSDMTPTTIASNHRPISPPQDDDDEHVVQEEEQPFHHGQHNKQERFTLLCDLLVTLFPPSDKNYHMFDIAGGKGELAFHLRMAGYDRVTLIDPRPTAGHLSHRLRKQWRKHCARNASHTTDQSPPMFEIRRELFDEHTTLRRHDKDAITPVLIGLHPDEATEAIVRNAIARNLPFCIVPCCVYARLFPHRPRSVRTHAHLCDYLQALAPKNIQRTILQGGGTAAANVVLYHLGDYDQAYDKEQRSLVCQPCGENDNVVPI